MAPTILVAKRLSRLVFESRNILASVSFIFIRKIREECRHADMAGRVF
jgi:hypothetical protein